MERMKFCCAGIMAFSLPVFAQSPAGTLDRTVLPVPDRTFGGSIGRIAALTARLRPATAT